MMYQWALYDHPLDFPDRYVARQFAIGPGVVYATNNVVVSKSLKFIADTLLSRYPDLVYIPRTAGDDPAILGVYM